MEKSNVESASKKRLTIQDRLDILRCLESDETGASLARKYGVCKSAISQMKSSKEKILASEQTIIESHGSLTKKRAPTVEGSPLDQALYSWFRQKRSRGDPVSGPVLKEKALQLNEKLQGPSSFKATDGYLMRFKNRHGLHHLSVQGERLSADKIARDEFCEKFDQEMEAQGYTTDRIYNAGETGLWWKTLPNKTFATYDESRADGYKIAKDRITLMVCANASGTHKLPLFAIGKSAKPRCFEQIQTLPVKYTGQKSAWMDRNKFMEWYTEIFVPEIEKKHRGSGEKCELLLDNAPTHPAAEVLNAVTDLCKVVYMPPNVTSLIQPMDQGVIEKLKKIYRKNFLRDFLLTEDSEQTVQEFLKDWNILKCLAYAAKAWESLTEDNLRNTWNNLVPQKTMDDTQRQALFDQEDLDVNTFTRLAKRSGHMKNLAESDTGDWLNEDTIDHGWQLLSDEGILFPEAEAEEETNEDQGDPDESDCTAEEALRALDKYQSWFQKRWDLTPEDWENMFLSREHAISIALHEKFPGAPDL